MPPVMIYGDDVCHVVTEEGVAYLYKAHRWPTDAAHWPRSPGHAGRAARRRRADRALRRDGLVAFPEDLKVEIRLATAPCWPPAASTTWSLGLADCTTRPRSSGTGERHAGRQS